MKNNNNKKKYSFQKHIDCLGEYKITTQISFLFNKCKKIRINKTKQKDKK